MRTTVLAHLDALMQAHRDMVEHLPAEALGQKLPVPSNTIGQQYWCVVGGRESHTRALEAGEWVGFRSSLTRDQLTDKEAVLAALDAARRTFTATIESLEWDDVRHGILMDLLEHESMHQGQLIRYGYALPYGFPKSWADRWAL